MCSICERATRPENWSSEDLLALWQNKLHSVQVEYKAYAENAVISTAAVALMAMEKLDFMAAFEKAGVFWNKRL